MRISDWSSDVCSSDLSCVDNIMLRDPDGKELKAEWKPVKPGVVEVKLPLQDAQPGTMSLMIDQYGLAKPHLIPLRVFSNAARPIGRASCRERVCQYV